MGDTPLSSSFVGNFRMITDNFRTVLWRCVRLALKFMDHSGLLCNGGVMIFIVSSGFLGVGLNPQGELVLPEGV